MNDETENTVFDEDDEEIYESRRMVDSPALNTISLISDSCELANSWFEKRNTLMKFIMQITPPVINVLAQPLDDQKRALPAENIAQYSMNVYYAGQVPESIFHQLLNAVLSSRKPELITRLTQPIVVKISGVSPFTSRQAPLGVYYTQGMPFMWYMSRETGRLFVYDMLDTRTLFVEFDPSLLLLNEGVAMNYEQMSIYDHMANTALVVMRSAAYTANMLK
jgi:hypothetical protein